MLIGTLASFVCDFLSSYSICQLHPKVKIPHGGEMPEADLSFTPTLRMSKKKRKLLFPQSLSRFLGFNAIFDQVLTFS